VSAADSVSLTINPAPVKPVANDTAICAGNTAILTASGNNIQWFTDPTLLNMAGTGNSFNTGQTGVGTYTYYAAGYAAGCGNSASDTAVLTINPVPLVTANIYTATITVGGSVTLTAYNAVTYSWAPPAGLNVTTGATVIASPTITTTYTVTGTNQYGCSSSKTILVIVNPLGVPLIEPVENLKIYPNPAIGEFTIEFNTSLSAPIEINMVNMLGERENVVSAKETRGGTVTKYTYKIDTHHFTEGIYNVEIVTEKGTVNRRITLFR
jgi:hypothetical protein